MLASGSAGAGAPSQLQPQLPDLVQVTPSHVSVVAERVRGRRRFHLIFRSAAENRGYEGNGGGSLVLRGHRASRSTATMTVDQYVDMFNPQSGSIDTQTVYANVGRMRYVRSEDHRHWHYVGFERYELRRASDYRLVAPDRKTGFCVGNRYQTRGARAALRITYRDFSDYCEPGRPGVLSVTVGLSPGWGDDYKPRLEGQYVDVTSARSGRYVLVHRVNVDRRIRETDYSNDAASILVELRRRSAGAKPTVRIVRRCPGQARCGAVAVRTARR
jgi:hypothetical protein